MIRLSVLYIKGCDFMKKIVKLLISGLVVATLTWAITFGVNMNRANNLQKPFLLNIVEIEKDGGSTLYRGIGYKYYVKKYVNSNNKAEIIETTMTFGQDIVGLSRHLVEKEYFFEFEEYDMKLEVPYIIYENCYSEVKDNSMRIYLNDGKDFVFAVGIANKQENINKDFTHVLDDNFNDQYVVYLQYPTCGTLNNENIQELWSEIITISKGFTKNNTKNI